MALTPELAKLAMETMVDVFTEDGDPMTITRLSGAIAHGYLLGAGVAVPLAELEPSKALRKLAADAGIEITTEIAPVVSARDLTFVLRGASYDASQEGPLNPLLPVVRFAQRQGYIDSDGALTAQGAAIFEGLRRAYPT